MAERLYRSRDDRMLAGVAGGVAEILDADPSLVRIVWAVLAVFTGGIAVLVYVVMAIVVPEAPSGWSTSTAGSTPGVAGAPGPTGTPGMGGSGAAAGGPQPGSYWATGREARREARRARLGGSADASRAGLVGGLVLIVIGVIFLVRELVPWFDWDVWWPLGLILLGGLFLVLALLPNRPSE